MSRLLTLPFRARAGLLIAAFAIGIAMALLGGLAFLLLGTAGLVLGIPLAFAPAAATPFALRNHQIDMRVYAAVCAMFGALSGIYAFASWIMHQKSLSF